MEPLLGGRRQRGRASHRLRGADRLLPGGDLSRTPWLHVFSAIIVAVGTAILAFWILPANSWMQAPAGHEVRDGVAYPVDWLTVIFNPTFFYRLPHMLTAAYLTTSFVVLSVGARYILAARHIDEGRTMMHMAIGMLAALGPLQVSIGDEHGRNALEPTASHATSGSNRVR